MQVVSFLMWLLLLRVVLMQRLMEHCLQTVSFYEYHLKVCSSWC